ncbi:MAG TPA: sterol desaturase family protein, partial [Gaiellales bacterium]|nr:sterol desaturase family protein [Gaiellales bacterium]
WTHRLLHTRLFWPLHVFHHAAERFTVATTYRVHPLDLATGFLSKLIIPLLLGFRPDLVLAGAVVFKVQALYAHSNLPEQPWLGRWLSFGPRGHGLHHSLDPRHRDRNFGSFVLWDRLFGTYLAVDGPQPAIGIDDGRERDLCLGQHPLRVMVVLQVDWACGLLRAARSRFARPADLSR